VEGAEELCRRSAQEWRIAVAGRQLRFQGGAEFGNDARLGDLPQRAHRAHPIRSDNADRAATPPGNNAAADQQILSDRSISRPKPSEVSARWWHPDVRRQLAQSDRRTPRLGP